VRALRGGAATAVHAVDVTDARGRRHRLVLRRFVQPSYRDPELARREARALAIVGPSGLPAPELVALDAEARRCDAPAVLMTRLPGRVDLTPEDRDAWLAQLAAPLPRIHALRPPADTIPPYRRYYDKRRARVPQRTRRPDAWARLIEAVQRRPPRTPRGLIHRDYHPTNVLWSHGRLSGIVDWTNASIGPVEVDLAHCRVNLAALYGAAAADAFLARALAALGRATDDYDPYWDANALTDSGFLSSPDAFGGWAGTPGPDLSPRAIAGRLDAYAVSIAARC
jgi:aminoglycoside phosphotransferase (APT) family kinase protein